MQYESNVHADRVGARSRLARSLASVVFAASVMLAGCGGDDGEGGGAEGRAKGEPCSQPGYTETGCMCDNGGVGSRSCTADKEWTPCACAPPRDPNACDFEGQEIQCDPCQGMEQGRMVTCPASLTFDCSCRGQAAPVSDEDAGVASGTMDAGASSSGDAAMSMDDESDAGANDQGSSDEDAG